ncbi:hypothetical protein [Sinorhizobium meliloti]|uniref:hypothetical protein n=1 Tax=Rhizobium meliloti TaxID=382 RepID=UPI0020917E91|nr:hypothetical protein [Sinorhizobium meliloti]
MIHPINYIAQAEGGILFGLSSLLRERATFTGGAIDQNNFYDYEAIRINAIPEVEVRLIESGAPPSGEGEIVCHDWRGSGECLATYHRTRPRPFSGSWS